MRKLLLLLVCAFVSIGTWAYGGQDGQSWTYDGSSWSSTSGMTGSGLRFQTVYETPKFQLVESGQSGLLAQWMSDKSDQLSYFADTNNTHLKLSGQFTAAELKTFFSKSFFSQYQYVDMSDVEMVGDYDLTAFGLQTTQTVILPSAPRMPNAAELGYFYNNNFPCVAYFAEAAHNNLNVYCLDDKVAALAPVVKAHTSIRYSQFYNEDGTQPTDGRLYPSVLHSAITGLSQLPVAEVDLTWANVSDLKDADGKYHYNLNPATHYLVIPQSESQYSVGADFTNESGSDYTYGDNIWVVSTFKGKTAPYATGAVFGGQLLITRDDPQQGGINESTNITYIRKNGALAGATPYLTDYAMNAERMIVVSKPGAGKISAAEGYVSDLASMANSHSVSVDLTQYIVPSGEDISTYGNAYVEHVALPDNTSLEVMETILGNCSCPTSIGVFNTADKHLYTHSQAPNQLTKVVQMIESARVSLNSSTPAGNVEKITMKGLLTGADFASTSSKYGISADGTIDPNSPAGGDAPALWGANVKYADFSDAAFVPESQFVPAKLGYAETVETILLPEAQVQSCDGTTYQQTTLPDNCLQQCTELSGELVVPDNITTIGNFAFAACSSLESATFGRNVRNIGTDLFSGDGELKEVSLNTGLTNISDRCFNGCVELKTVDIPEGVTVIGESAFQQLEDLSAIKLPTTLVTIEASAFKQCFALSTVIIPENVESIGDNAFSLCYNLRDVYFMGTTTIPSCSKKAFDTMSYFNNNAASKRATSGTYAQDEYGDWHYDEYYDQESYGRTDERGANGKVYAAIMHYPHVSQEAVYGAATVDADAYNAAKAADPVTLYEKVGDNYVAVSGMPEDGKTYYTVSYNAADSYESTTTPQTGVSQYYSDQKGTVTTPIVANGYYIQCGTNDVYTQVNKGGDVIGAQDQYYIKSGDTYTPSDLKFYYWGSYRSMYYATEETQPVTHYGTLAAWTNVSNVIATGKTEFYKLEGGEYVSYEPKFSQYVQPWYYDEATNEYKRTDVYIPGVSKYYKLDNGSYKEENFQMSGDCAFYYVESVTQEPVYDESDHFLPGKTWYTYDGNTKTYTQVTLSWYNHFKDDYYYKSGSEPKYCSQDGAAYDASETYYSDQNGTVASPVNFNGTYYYHPATAQYSTASADDVNTAKLQNTTLYTKDGEDYTAVTGNATAGTSYYVMTQEGSDDLYAKYYTVVERNNTYRGFWYDANGDGKNVTDMEKWPSEADVQKWSDMSIGGKDYPLIDGKDYSGLKNFLLTGGYIPGETVVNIFEGVDMWYTIYLPYDLTRRQIYEIFGASTQVCDFLGIRKDGKDIVIDFSKNRLTNPDKDGVEPTDETIGIHANTPYMIHPSVVVQVAEDGAKTPVQFRATGVAQIDKASEDETGANPYFGLYDSVEGERKNAEAAQNYIPGYKFLGTYGQNNDGVTSVVMTEPCYYFGNVWQDKEKFILKYQSFWYYKGKQAAGWDLSWKPYTAIIKYVGDETSNPAKAVNQVNFGVGYDDIYNNGVADQIETVSTEAKESVNPRFNGGVYSVNGQYMGTSLEGLPKGIYLMNGKKYVVK